MSKARELPRRCFRCGKTYGKPVPVRGLARVDICPRCEAERRQAELPLTTGG